MRKITELACQAFKRGESFRMNNTKVVVEGTYEKGRIYTMLLHGNPIATRDNGLLTINSCSWTTPTTKERLNGVLKEFNTASYIAQSKGKWYLYKKSDRFDNYDRIEWQGTYAFKI